MAHGFQSSTPGLAEFVALSLRWGRHQGDRSRWQRLLASSLPGNRAKDWWAFPQNSIHGMDHTRDMDCVTSRGWLFGAALLFLPFGSNELNSGCQVYWQALLHTESSCWSIHYCINIIPLDNSTFLFLSVEVTVVFLMFLATSQINKYNKNDFTGQYELRPGYWFLYPKII